MKGPGKSGIIYAKNGPAVCGAAKKERPYKGGNTMAINTDNALRRSVIYEVYVRSHTPEGTFKAIEPDLDRIAALGVDIVWFMPIHPIGELNKKGSLGCPYANRDYRTVNPEYGTLEDFLHLVEEIHKRGMKCIIDVVYNHTSPDSTLVAEHPDYFYYKPDGCRGNKVGDWTDVVDLNYENRALWQYQIDSLCYWASEYHIDGFRFDLMGVLDIETLNEARKALLKINPDIIMYGEGWTGGESTLPESERGMKINAPRTPGIGMFSDDIRDAVKGHVFYMDELGFVNGAADRGEELKQAVTCAKWAKSPMQSINYLSCHDNYTLWDRFIISNSHESEEMRIRMNKLAAAILFTAQGIPFFLHGEEFARTKISEADGAPVENSYCSPISVNAIDYDRAEQFSDLKAYYKGLIALRRAHKSFYLDTVDEIKKSIHFMDDMPDGVVAYTIDNDTEKVFVAYNAGKNKITIKLADALWEVLADEASAGDKALYTIKDQAIIPGVSCLVAVCKC